MAITGNIRYVIIRTLHTPALINHNKQPIQEVLNGQRILAEHSVSIVDIMIGFLISPFTKENEL